MRWFKPSQLSGLRRLSWLTWAGEKKPASFVFDIPANGTGFVGFFLRNPNAASAPRLLIDKGDGFSELTALGLKYFPFAFYHYPLAPQHGIRRIGFSLSEVSKPIGFAALRTNNAVLIAILHYLFNLRYRGIGVLDANATRSGVNVASVAASIKRIVRFLRQVSQGGAVRIQSSEENTIQLLRQHMAIEATALQSHMIQTLAASDAGPLVSFVVPVFNTSPDYLDALIESFKIQDAPYAEMILSDDGSTQPLTLRRLEVAQGHHGVRVVRNDVNRGIAGATNSGVLAARGAWIAFVDHDDQLASGAAAVIADAILRHPAAVFFYTDEIVTDATLTPIGLFCKPAFDSVLLSGMNYINHLAVYRRDRLIEIGLLSSAHDGSQDYDLLLRYLAAAKAGEVVHIPYAAYLWRRNDDTYSQVNVEKSVANARDALAKAYQSGGSKPDILPALDPHHHRVRFPQDAAAISVIIPNKDSLHLLKRVIDGLIEQTLPAPSEIIIVDNGSRDPAVLAYYGQLREATIPVRVEIREEPFNFAKMCNRGAALATGERLLFLNNDIEVLEPDWLAEMASCLAYPETGIVGAKLLYPTRTIQHAGVIVGLGEAAGHWYCGEAEDAPGPMGRLNVRQTLGSVTGACMLVTRACFTAVGGFDEVAFPIAYNDVDFCLRAKACGFRTVWTPFACLIHHESQSRGSDESGENNLRFRIEFGRLQERHGTADLIDDAYSPLYDRRYSAPHVIVPATLPKLRPNVFS